MPSCQCFTLLNHATVKRYREIKLCTKVIVASVALWQRIVSHIERRKRHSCAVTGVISVEILSAWCSIILELHGLIGHIARCSCDWRCIVANCRVFCCFNRSYCEKTESEVVVDSCVMVSVTSIVSIIPAARVTVSS